MTFGPTPATQGHVALLHGEVPSDADRSRIEWAVLETPGVMESSRTKAVLARLRELVPEEVAGSLPYWLLVTDGA